MDDDEVIISSEIFHEGRNIKLRNQRMELDRPVFIKGNTYDKWNYRITFNNTAYLYKPERFVIHDLNSKECIALFTEKKKAAIIRLDGMYPSQFITTPEQTEYMLSNTKYHTKSSVIWPLPELSI